MKIIIKLLFLLLIVPVTVIATEYEDARNAGKDAANSIRSELGTGEKIVKRLGVPMTDPETPLNTFGPVADQESMNIEISTQSSNEFLTITASPASTGDIRNLSIEMDTNFDGSVDSTYIVPYTVSGVCANGFISCRAGTWDGCTNYEWRFRSNSGIRAEPVSSQDELRGCYCVNTGCNSTITFDNMPLVLKDIGGAVVGAIQAQAAKYSITHVEVDQSSIKYYGQDTGDIESNQDGYFSGVSRPQNLYNPQNDSQLNATAERHASRQNGDSDSFSTLLSSSYAAIDQPVSEQECIIRHSVTFSGGSPPVVQESNSCQGFDFSNCKLKEEYICDYGGVSCVQTFDNFNPTLLKPITYCEQMPPYTFCNDGTSISQSGRGVIYAGPETWFYIRRIYQCQEVNQDYSSESEIQRAGQVMETVNQSGGRVTYQDVDPVSGQVTQQDFQYPDVEEIPDCETACKIMRPIKNTDVLKEGTVTDYKRSNDSFEYVVVPCDVSGVCPLEPGDNLVTDCSCISSFAEMVSIMEGLRIAGEDMVCSQD